MTDTKDLIQPDRGQDATAIHLVNKDGFEDFAKTLSAGQRASLAAQKFDGSGYQVGIVPDGDGFFAVGGVANPESLSSWCLAALAEALPGGTYRLAGERQAGVAMFGWMTAQYRFTRYRAEDKPAGPRVLLTGEIARMEALRAEAEAEMKVRDLVNTPAEDMGPAALEAECEKLAKAHGAQLKVTRGDTLEQEYPMVHAVGRAAARHHAPRIMHLTWGDEGDPVLAIVGKGVCFDSGGLDIKPGSGMRLMKKDMGGAAHAIALAGLVMGAQLKVRLHLLVPAVENAISGSAFRPGDVLASRKGLTVEIHNTDAEGRLILGDALTRASEEEPDLIVDFATLTGAARVAVGPDFAAMMARRDDTAEAFLAAGKENDDAPWRLPLPDSYREWLSSDIADLANAHQNAFAGASVAGLFLDRFVAEGLDWVHFDTFAWRPSAKPGRAKGGGACGLRASWHALRKRYGG
ncbi:leucyl aminopeptidase [Erythrobacter litoralis]|jgi:leucyl aminopeptidase|uniref:Cytosol aminopeptidase n=1 Tax=Erythrobacter litoralis TaxID=39960 RepID=A0A074MKR4_9SPHN|nr:leucyl aminopeptidase family protein [Erythrobacter litoralis]AOL24362.1 leucyl aminopeptidase [Erythrobacter litoralis]KEO93395.1 cytosol aminopeptidase [Erythrobacter litoralis]MEE4339557.1 leucyl aminopeptidase family protein [Erythrobacter sp.]